MKILLISGHGGNGVAERIIEEVSKLPIKP